MSDKTPELTVYYDGACPLCRVEINHYRAQPGADQICFADVSDQSNVPEGLDQADLLRRFHVRDRVGTLRSGAAGFVAIWTLLPKWRWAARLAARPAVLWLMERGYRGFLPLRPTLSRLFGKMTRH